MDPVCTRSHFLSGRKIRPGKGRFSAIRSEENMEKDIGEEGKEMYL